MTALDELAELIARHAAENGMHRCALPRVTLIRSSTPTEPMPTVYEPSMCLVAQGRKRAMLGSSSFIYDAAKFLVVSVDLLVTGTVIDASPERPYLCLQLNLDLPTLGELLVQHGEAAPSRSGTAPSLALSEVTPGLIDAAVRLLRLLDAPSDIAALAPLVEREILYRLLTGEQGEMLRHIATAESRLGQISRAIAWIKDNFSGPMRVEELAERAGMSVSSFHQHFKAVTAMSPLQYRTQLRLQEARRLMVADGMDAASAGFAVGYDSPSHFSRDYVRAFGAPPSRDAARLREMPDYALVA